MGVLAFQKQIVEGAVCWKIQEFREKKRPSVCPDGFSWNGEQFCLPTQSSSSSLLQSSAAARSLEATAVNKDTVDSSAGGKVPMVHSWLSVSKAVTSVRRSGIGAMRRALTAWRSMACVVRPSAMGR